MRAASVPNLGPGAAHTAENGSIKVYLIEIITYFPLWKTTKYNIFVPDSLFENMQFG